MMPRQYSPDRIKSEDVQSLIKSIIIRPSFALTPRFPREEPVDIEAKMKNGKTIKVTKRGYNGFYASPMSWDEAISKFESLAAPCTGAELRKSIKECISQLEEKNVSHLTELLEQVRTVPIP